MVKEITTDGDETNHYLILETPAGERFAPTLTCAANFLGYVEKEHYAHSDSSTANLGFAQIARHLGVTEEKLLDQIFDLALDKVEAPLRRLIHEYRLDVDMVELIGGGGGAAAILPALQKRCGWTCRISRNAPIISAIGVALAMVKEVVERTIVNPTDEDVLRVRHEARSAAIRAGALADTVEVRVEADRQKSILRATATGAAEIREVDEKKEPASEAGLLEIAAVSLSMPADLVSLAASAESFFVFQGKQKVKRLGGLWSSWRQGIRVLDQDGVVRLRRSQGKIVQTTAAGISGEIFRAVVDESSFGDAGQILPDVFLLHSGRIANFTGIAQVDHVSKLANDELQGARENEPVVLLVCHRDVSE